MYESHFGLTISPFATSPDPRFLFFTSSHREALAGLMYGILNRKGFVSLVGDAGTGKTSLLRRVLEAVNGNKSLIVSPTVSAADFIKLVMANFGMDPVPTSRADQFIQFEKFLEKSREEDKLCVLVIDEAQRLSPGVLEEIRLLTNFEHADGKLLQIVLAGQPELRDHLNRPDLWQLKQRIAMRLSLKPLAGFEEIQAYVRHRWSTAGGGDSAPFSDEALRYVVKFSSCIPRIVNVLCDNALLLAFAEEAQTVTDEHIKSAAIELDLPAMPAPVTSNGANGYTPAANGIHAHSKPVAHATHSNGIAPLQPSFGSRPAAPCPKLERLQPIRTRRSRIWRWFAK